MGENEGKEQARMAAESKLAEIGRKYGYEGGDPKAAEKAAQNAPAILEEFFSVPEALVIVDEETCDAILKCVAAAKGHIESTDFVVRIVESLGGEENAKRLSEKINNAASEFRKIIIGRFKGESPEKQALISAHVFLNIIALEIGQ